MLWENNMSWENMSQENTMSQENMSHENYVTRKLIAVIIPDG
jgi:hypothetical protein